MLDRNLQKVENDYLRIVNHCIEKIYYYERTPQAQRNQIKVDEAIKQQMNIENILLKLQIHTIPNQDDKKKNKQLHIKYDQQYSEQESSEFSDELICHICQNRLQENQDVSDFIQILNLNENKQIPQLKRKSSINEYLIFQQNQLKQLGEKSFLENLELQYSGANQSEQQNLNHILNKIQLNLKEYLNHQLEHLCFQFLKVIVTQLQIKDQNNFQMFQNFIEKRNQELIKKQQEIQKFKKANSQTQDNEDIIQIYDKIKEIQNNNFETIKMSTITIQNFRKKDQLPILISNNQDNQVKQQDEENKQSIFIENNQLVESLEGEIKISQNQIIKQLRDQIELQKQEIAQLNNKLESNRDILNKTMIDKKFAQDSLIKARMSFTKELLNLQDQLVQATLPQNEEYEYVNCNFMDLTETFEESIKVVWEYQKKVIVDSYNSILHRCQSEMEKQRDKIHKFERLCEDGNVFIKLSDMNADFIVGKLLIVEEDPFKVWAALNNQYGNGYFNQVIEKSLGVTADYKEDLYNKYRKKLLATTYENEKKLEEMEKTLKQKLKKYKEMYTKQMQINTQITDEFNKKFITEFGNIRLQILNQMEQKYQSKYKIQQDRIQKLHDRNEKIHKEYNSIVQESQSFNLQHSMMKWRFQNKLKMFSEQLKRINFQMLSEDLLIELNSNLIKMNEEMFSPKKFMFGKRNKLQLVADMEKKLMENDEQMDRIMLENQEIKIKANDCIIKYNNSQYLLESQNIKVSELSQYNAEMDIDLKAIKMNYELLKESSDFRDFYIDMMEKNQTNFNLKLKKLSAKHPALLFFKKEPLEQLDEFRNKVNIQYAKKQQVVVSNILGERHRNKFQQTDIQGLDKMLQVNLSQIESLFPINGINIEIQATVDTQEQCEGVEPIITIEMESQTDLMNTEFQMLQNSFLQLYEEFQVFDEDIQRQNKRAIYNKNYKVNFKDNLDLSLLITKQNLLDIQKVPMVTYWVNEKNLPSIGQLAQFTNAQAKYKRIKGNRKQAKTKSPLRSGTSRNIKNNLNIVQKSEKQSQQIQDDLQMSPSKYNEDFKSEKLSNVSHLLSNSENKFEAQSQRPNPAQNSSSRNKDIQSNKSQKKRTRSHSLLDEQKMVVQNYQINEQNSSSTGLNQDLHVLKKMKTRSPNQSKKLNVKKRKSKIALKKSSGQLKRIQTKLKITDVELQEDRLINIRNENSKSQRSQKEINIFQNSLIQENIQNIDIQVSSGNMKVKSQRETNYLNNIKDLLKIIKQINQKSTQKDINQQLIKYIINNQRENENDERLREQKLIEIIKEKQMINKIKQKQQQLLNDSKQIGHVYQSTTILRKADGQEKIIQKIQKQQEYKDNTESIGFSYRKESSHNSQKHSQIKNIEIQNVDDTVLQNINKINSTGNSIDLKSLNSQIIMNARNFTDTQIQDSQVENMFMDNFINEQNFIHNDNIFVHRNKNQTPNFSETEYKRQNNQDLIHLSIGQPIQGMSNYYKKAQNMYQDSAFKHQNSSDINIKHLKQQTYKIHSTHFAILEKLLDEKIKKQRNKLQESLMLSTTENTQINNYNYKNQNEENQLIEGNIKKVNAQIKDAQNHKFGSKKQSQSRNFISRTQINYNLPYEDIQTKKPKIQFQNKQISSLEELNFYETVKISAEDIQKNLKIQQIQRANSQPLGMKQQDKAIGQDDLDDIYQNNEQSVNQINLVINPIEIRNQKNNSQNSYKNIKYKNRQIQKRNQIKIAELRHQLGENTLEQQQKDSYNRMQSEAFLMGQKNKQYFLQQSSEKSQDKLRNSEFINQISQYSTLMVKKKSDKKIENMSNKATEVITYSAINTANLNLEQLSNQSFQKQIENLEYKMTDSVMWKQRPKTGIVNKGLKKDNSPDRAFGSISSTKQFMNEKFAGPKPLMFMKNSRQYYQSRNVRQQSIKNNFLVTKLKMNDPYQSIAQVNEKQLIIGSTSIASVLEKYRSKITLEYDKKDETQQIQKNGPNDLQEVIGITDEQQVQIKDAKRTLIKISKE